jgi:hypothetical protein
MTLTSGVGEGVAYRVTGAEAQAVSANATAARARSSWRYSANVPGVLQGQQLGIGGVA